MLRALLCILLLTAATHAQSIWDLQPGLRPARAVITLTSSAPEVTPDDSAMTLVLRGVLADLKGKDLDRLRATAPPNPLLGDASNAEELCTVHLIAAQKSKRISILRKDDGFIALELDPAEGEDPRRAELRRDATADLLASFPLYRGGFMPIEAKITQTTFEVEKPYEPGRFTLDTETIGKRFLNGRTSAREGTTRVLADETFHARLPKNYNPRTPAGLLVWINAGNTGEPPAVFHEACDALNIIAIGPANAGNIRHSATRYQLAFDAVATASRRWHIDPRRVYITGISGGGRISSNLAVCFPDVFAGSIPIVGINCYEPIPNGMGQFWAPGFVKPGSDRLRILRTRRIAAMTGRNDPNQLQTQQAAEIYKGDGIPIRVFDDEKMGHELPTSKAFAEALAWIDEPYQKLRAAEKAAADQALAEYLKRYPNPRAPDQPLPPQTPAQRKHLYTVTDEGPWTPAAWQAAELLGLVDTGG